VYPFGGKFDDSTFEGMLLGDGGGGAGVTPIMLASSSDFMIAEARWEASNKGDAITYLVEGLNKSVEKVISFGLIDPSYDGSFEPTDTEKIEHRALIAGQLGASVDEDGVLDVTLANPTEEEFYNVLGREFFTALYGNGIEGYNFYRRTRYPSNLQPNIEPDPGAFILSFFYPANFVNNNSSVPQKSNLTTPVFWAREIGEPLSN
jgi:hypothetical protein